jgi:hypothetical protein
MYKPIAIALAAIVVSLSAVACGTETVKSEPVTPAATQPAVFDGKAYAKKIEKAFVAVNGRSIKQSCNFAEPTWHCYYAGIKAESESWVTMTLAFDGGVSENQARDMAKRASLAFFNFVGDDFKKLDMITVYGTVHGTRLDIGTTYRRDVPLLNM